MSIEIIPFNTIGPDSPLLRIWNEKVAAERNLYGLYQAFTWLSCTATPQRAQPRLLVSRNGADPEPTVLTPIAPENVPLRFRAARREFANVQLRCMEVLGGRVLGDPDYATYCAIVRGIFEQSPEIQGIYFKSVPSDSALWNALAARDWRLDGARAYRLDGERPFHYAELPNTFDGYLGEFRKKQRYNLKRQVRLMNEGVGNSLRMTLVDSREQIASFLDDVRRITVKSWKAELEESGPDMADDPDALRALADTGLLRAYLLSANDAPVAYALGYRHRDVYHYANIGYDADFAKYSPGAVLLLQMIQDLIDNAGVRYMNFGITDANYKRVFGNRHISDASIVVLRPGLRNSLLASAHGAFESAKNLLRRRRAPAPAAADEAE